MRTAARHYRPFASSGRATIIAIFVTFGLVTAVTLTLSINVTNRAQSKATVVEVVGRQRTLAERYMGEVLLRRAGRLVDPSTVGSLMTQSVRALLDGGTAPAVPGDDDDIALGPTSDTDVRHQLQQEAKLIHDLTAYGSAVLANRPLDRVPQTAGEKITLNDPFEHLRVLTALTSNVALNTARTIATQADQSITSLRFVQIVLQIGGLLFSLLLACALILTTRRQTAHFRSLVTSSSDLVIVLGHGGCRYASPSLCRMVGRVESDLLGGGLRGFVHEDDLAAFDGAQDAVVSGTMMLRIRNAAGEWRHLEANLTDLRGDRHLRGVVLTARDATERVKLEHKLSLQSRRDGFGRQLNEALEMVDEEDDAFDLVQRAMVSISPDAPTELLLADSSRAHLGRVASSPSAGAPGCPVNSPFACVAVRRGQPVTFESSEALNACPKLRDREGGPCSAVCVPVAFMGRALGVLHATGPEGQPLEAEQTAQLTMLAGLAGSRIGTLRAFERTQLQAATDGLTGLINRRTLETQVRALIGRQRPFALAVADLDRFKLINDTYGHEAGDKALRLFAQVAGDALRGEDILARWGGEEFVIVLPDTERDGAVAVLERLRERLAAAHTGEHPSFTASFGVTDSDEAQTVEQLIRIADAGLYRSKQSGRDRITIGTPEAEPVPGTSGNGQRRPRTVLPLLHEAASEPEPRPSGLEIR